MATGRSFDQQLCRPSAKPGLHGGIQWQTMEQKALEAGYNHDLPEKIFVMETGKQIKNKKSIVIDEKTPLLVLAGPMFLELFLNTMLNNIDTIMLSHYDEYAVGAVGNANTIMFMMNILFNVIATATSVVAAQYLGAKQYDKMNTIYTLAVMVNLMVGVVLSGLFSGILLILKKAGRKSKVAFIPFLAIGTLAATAAG